MFENLPTVPADDAEVREQQLLRELDRLKNAGEVSPAYRTYLEHGMTRAWAALARGELNAPRRQLEHLKRVRPFVDSHMPDLSITESAAVEIGAAIECLHQAHEAVEPLLLERRIADQGNLDHATSREVLRALSQINAPDGYMNRGQVHKQISPTKSKKDGGNEKVTAARVGQILDQFYVDRLVLRSMQPGKGGMVGYYRLSPRGEELSKQIVVTSHRGTAALPDDYGHPQLMERPDNLNASDPLQIRVTSVTRPPA